MKTPVNLPLLRTPLLDEEDDLLAPSLSRSSSLSLQVEDPQPRVAEFLERFGLSLRDLHEHNINPRVLQQMIDKRCSGYVMRWLALDDMLTKLLLFPWLDERGIRED